MTDSSMNTQWLRSLTQPGRPILVRRIAQRALEGEPGIDRDAVLRVVEMTQPSGAERAGSPVAPTAVPRVAAARAPVAVSPTAAPVGEQLVALVDRLRAEQPHERTYDQRLADLELSVALLLEAVGREAE